MVYYKFNYPVRGKRQVHLFEKSMQAVNGIITLEEEPSPRIRIGLRMRGYRPIAAPPEKSPITQPEAATPQDAAPEAPITQPEAATPQDAAPEAPSAQPEAAMPQDAPDEASTPQDAPSEQPDASGAVPSASEGTSGPAKDAKPQKAPKGKANKPSQKR